jgi:nicotinamide mononucleotide (NMN) deamidase PncC
MKTIVWLGLAMIPGIALAASPPEKQDKKHDGMVCRDVAQTGSRLDVKRVCMTKEEWEEARRQARESIEKVQMARAWTAG